MRTGFFTTIFADLVEFGLYRLIGDLCEYSLNIHKGHIILKYLLLSTVRPECGHFVVDT